jgi:colanic acid/amylovoran biosynthesis glycosyltransferase
VCRHHAALKYTIVGGGPLRAELEAQARSLGIGDNVRWLGSARHDHAIELLKEADVFLLPSVTGADGDQEGTPIVLMEALAHAVPVVSTRHSGIPEIVQDGESGFLVPERDAGALAQKLRLLLERPSLRHRMGAAGRTTMRREFDIGKLNDRLLEVYGRVLAK